MLLQRSLGYTNASRNVDRITNIDVFTILIAHKVYRYHTKRRFHAMMLQSEHRGNSNLKAASSAVLGLKTNVLTSRRRMQARVASLIGLEPSEKLS